MEEKTEIHAVELVRRIRDEQAQLLEGKSNDEIIDFFRRAGDVAKFSGRKAARDAGEPQRARDWR